MLSDFRDRLRLALGTAPLDPAEAAGALAAADAARSSGPGGARPALSPWAAWTLVGLLRYLPRQLWVGELARERVLTSEHYTAVPGFPGWFYAFETPHCCRVSNAETGEVIEVELHEGSAEYIHPFYYVERLETLKRLEPPEARLRALHAVSERIVLAFDELDADGALIRHEHEYVYRLSDEARACEADMRAFVTRWEDPAARLWLAANLGDWPLAAELSPGDVRLQRAAERSFAARVRRLEAKLDCARFGTYALEALVEVAPADRLRRYLAAAIEAAPDGLTRMAVEMIVADEAVDFGHEMRDLFARLSPERDVDLLTTTAGYLLARGYADATVLPSLLRVVDVSPETREIGEIALVALEHAPGQALALVRLALRSPSAGARQQMAATLAMIGGAWTERELLSAMRESTDEQVTSTYRAALRRFGSLQAIAEIALWERAHQSPDKGPAWNAFAEAMIGHLERELGERVERVRKALPADFGGT